MFINPGYAGMREGICINGLLRQQWAGFKDYETGDNAAPEDYLITVDSPIKLLHGGIGGAIIQDKATYNWSDVSLLLSYSFQTELSIGTIGIGVGGVLKTGISMVQNIALLRIMILLFCHLIREICDSMLILEYFQLDK